MTRTFTYLLFALCAIASSVALAETYPDRPIRLIVPYPPGGGTDITARVIAKRMTEDIGQPVVVENRPGAGTLIGTDVVAKAAPDGYTLVFGSVTHTIAPALYKQMPFDAERDFTPIIQIAIFPFVLVVNPSVQATTVTELIALARARPGALDYASVGNGTGTHLAGEMFKAMSGTNIVHVPYKGTAQALPDILSGTVSMMFMDTPPAIPHVRSGTLRALAVSTAKRSPWLPDVPTITESGLPGFEFTSWWGVLGPAGMSREVTARLNAAFARALQAPEVRSRLESLAAEPIGGTPAQFALVLRSELGKFAQLAKDVRLTLD